LHNGLFYVQCRDDANVALVAGLVGGNGPFAVRLERNETDSWPSDLFATVSGINDRTAEFGDLGAGWYRMTVQDQRGCLSNAVQFQIHQATAKVQVDGITPSVFSHGANTICHRDANASIQVSASGGLMPYTYSLLANDGSPNSVVPDLNAPEYSFASLAAITPAETAITYSVYLRDVLGCEWDMSNNLDRNITLAAPLPVTLSWDITSRTQNGFEIPCRGDLAELSVSSRGGDFPHNVLVTNLSNPAQTYAGQISGPGEVITFSLPAATYSIDVVDHLGCASATQQIEINEPSTFVQLLPGLISPPPCIGGTNGRIEFAASNGVAGPLGQEYRFLIRSIGQTGFDSDTVVGASGSFFRPAAFYNSQDYEIQVIDHLGCSDFETITLPANPSPLELTAISNISPSCYGGNNGSIQIKAANYEFINGATLRFIMAGGHLGNSTVVIESTEDTHTFEGLEGTDTDGNTQYSFFIEDSHYCQDTASQYLSNERLQSHPPVLIDLMESTRPTCFNRNDGLLSIQVSGGVAPYLYSFNNLEFLPFDQIGTMQFSGLHSNNYTLYVKDANFVASQPVCARHEVFTVAPGRFLNLIADVERITCKDGSDGNIDLTVDVQNRNVGEDIDPSMISYSWVFNNVSSASISHNQDISSLEAGNYTVNVEYQPWGCQNQKSVNISEPVESFHITNVKVYPTSCGGDGNGRVVISLAGGWQNAINYYKIDNDDNWTAFSGNSFMTNGLLIGAHNIMVSQTGFACMDSKDFFVHSNKLRLEVDAVLPPGCPGAADGEIFLSSDDANVLFARVGGLFQTSNSFNNLSQGIHHFVARRFDNENCSSDTLEILVSDPLDCGNGPLTALATNIVSTTCQEVSDGHASILGMGGVPPYQFSVDGVPSTAELAGLNSGNHTVSVVDAVGTTFELIFAVGVVDTLTVETFVKDANCSNACDGQIDVLTSGGTGEYRIKWFDDEETASRLNLCSGHYAVAVSDARNQQCQVSRTIQLGSIPEISVLLSSEIRPTCAGGADGKLFLEAAGGSGQYDFAWDNGNTKRDLINVQAGDYVLTASDKILGCSVQYIFTLPEADPIQVDEPLIIQPSCFGSSDGQVRLSLSNTTAPLVTWSNGLLGTHISGITSGHYNYSIVDAKGCTLEGEVDIEDPPQLFISKEIISPTCSNTADGEITLAISGGTSPFTVNWAHGPRQLLVKNLNSGTYSYAVRDKHNCAASDIIEVIAPSQISIDAITTDPTCYSSADGSISLSSSGGTGQHRFTWNNQETSETLVGLKKGVYSVMVTDEHECRMSKSFVLNESAPLLVRVDRLRHPLCAESVDGLISVSGVGGTQPYTATWHDQNTDFTRDGLSGGNYDVQLTDKNICRATKQISLVSPGALLLNNEVVINPGCHGSQTGSIAVGIIGGNAPYNYLWNEAIGNNLHDDLAAGIYSVKIADAQGCELNTQYELIDPDPIHVTGIPARTILCEGGSIQLSPDGTWRSHTWLGPDGFRSDAPAVVASVEGNYNLKVTDENDCPAEVSFLVDISSNPIDADFLILSEAVIYEPIVFVDITMPEPESIEWLIPDDHDIVINKKLSGMIELIFTRAAEFEIGFTANLGKCVSTLTKKVVIQESSTQTSNPDGRFKVESSVDPQVTIYPNPVSQQIFLGITTPTTDPISLKLISFSGNQVIFSETLNGSFEYNLELNLPQLHAGVHTLLYEFGGRLYSKKVIVVR
jgi:hypothetical protein